MKVLMFHDDSNVLGGAEQYRRELACRLEALGHEVFTVACQDKAVAALDRGARILRSAGDLERTGRFKRVYFHPGLISEFRALLSEAKPDLVHLHNNLLFPLSIISAIPLALPLVQTIHDCRIVCPNGSGIDVTGEVCLLGHGMHCLRIGCLGRRSFWFRLPARKALEFLLRRRFDRVIVPSKALGEIFSHLGIATEHVPNFVSRLDVEASPVPDGAPKILFIGSLFPGKGVHVLLRALREVLKDVPELTADIVGSGPAEEELLKLSKELGLQECVRFTGGVPPERLKQYYTRATVLVLPATILENCPLVLLEAMAAGRPVIGSRVGGIPEIIVDGETGLLFEPNNSTDLADKLRIVLQNRQRANEMGIKGRQRAEQEYTAEAHMKRILGIYTQVLTKRSASNN
ncbi:MAG: glycosyltransferase family 1 protein [Candidatus Abyssobacteria bacterium SURF_5]|uniref:Glycosyltransferase family 1 protein n=1 Tax=Abyssobacteria bacterium (strain SURF_5) TaxID=2093360 RepID=A0A3A4PBZ0_ABYX5|nr:MAG: glycosyltransferase family 1 protein [Candidatus Abyssubacteria bacterium SURF_5]